MALRRPPRADRLMEAPKHNSFDLEEQALEML